MSKNLSNRFVTAEAELSIFKMEAKRDVQELLAHFNQDRINSFNSLYSTELIYRHWKSSENESSIVFKFASFYMQSLH